ncbi:MAG: glycosyltransferase family 4 protein [Rhodospirillales bacterium]|jgi:glycosyltransferase involved in cell wall biosynthesis
MKICFMDPIDWDYTVETPYQRPMGGSQSGLCYLAAELAKRGHLVSFANKTTTPGTYLGVDCLGSQNGFAVDFLKGQDAIVVLNTCIGESLRKSLGGEGPKLILWNQHAADQKVMSFLGQPAERGSWDAFALISDWQANEFIQKFGLDKSCVGILRNAISPLFENLALPKPWFANGQAPVFAYTSTPFRGLDVLLTAWPTIRKLAPGSCLKIYSSMKVYNANEEAHEILYALARDLKGVEMVGSVPQPDLAKALARASILAYPNTFAETSCIAVMEAMAAGCLVVTSDLGALPETLAGFGILLKPLSGTMDFAHAYAEAMRQVLEGVKKDPKGLSEHLKRQVEFARSEYSWSFRAKEWEVWLRQVTGKN